MLSSFFHPGPKTHSRLIINDVMIADSGNYSCSAPNTQPSSIDVFVSPGTGQVSHFIVCILFLSANSRNLLFEVLLSTLKTSNYFSNAAQVIHET